MTTTKQLAMYKKALAQSRENYASLLKDYWRMEARNGRQEQTIYRIRAKVRALADNL